MIVDLYKIPIGVSLGVVAGILALSIVASLLFQPKDAAVAASGVMARLGRRWNSRFHSLLSLNPGKVWMPLVLVVLVLTVITISSIRSGPSVHNAITAIRAAQRDLAQAQRVDRGSEFTSLSYADAALILARQALEEGHYEEAILAALKASQLARKAGRQR